MPYNVGVINKCRSNARVDNWLVNSNEDPDDMIQLIPPKNNQWQYLELSRLFKLGLSPRRLQTRKNSNISSPGSTIYSTESENSDFESSFVIQKHFTSERNSTVPFSTLKPVVTCGYYFRYDQGHYKEKIDVDPVNIMAWRPPIVPSIMELKDSINKDKKTNKKPAKRMK